MELKLTNAKIITPYKEIERGSVIIKDGIISEILEERTEGEDLEGMLLLPAFVDIHTHGIGGYDYTSWDSEDDFIKNAIGMKKKLIQHGVTTFLPTTVTMPRESLLEACKAISQTDILGLHLEGPYISEKHAGAQDVRYIRNPDKNEVLECVRESNNKVITITYSPEKDLDFIPFMLSLGIYPSIGHTDADYETAVKAFLLGASRVTHLFNAMRAFHHRDPGVILASINFSPFIEIIPDFIHVDKEVVRFLTKIVDIKRIVAVTDSIIATDLQDGTYTLGKMRIRVENGIARTEDGKLAGSTLTMDKAFKNLSSIIGIREASLICSYNPARAIGLSDRGIIEKGKRADLIVMDEKLNVKKVFINGEEIFSSS
ncbi:N-acetylglucosamine-6-phosphate deacetylase [Sulfurisphaera tokodaii]|uniref:N-acetylglucosamine-6-phosphate deacetylase n=2 Tax=Sulfurisphaera tokodaii TaxID=111955 RepID=Q96XG9_SULTO|nr:N-acetylglucosamine-6-phosphate deacetylase [Sulfurisphaera tokodaii]BAB67658.1 N-acetylglucosamine-6-phosphate deacetylase [Sulfurisphaera tokodaii str. 7]HII75342.1 N-acetylglucosamine-6-phosphate deacetylase [Sulfurisphaera tokodaii]